MDNLASIQSHPCPTVLLSQRLAVSDTGFVFDPVTGKSSTVNATGIAIIRQLQQQANIKQVISVLQKKFNLIASVLERDVIEFTDLLRKYFV
jgi:hypothetical protein